MPPIILRLERFLRLDTLTLKSDIMRVRAVYMIGFVFIATQMINQVAMTLSYGGFTVDHAISLVACALVVLTILCLRRSHYFPAYAAVYSVLIVAGVMSSALNQATGINTALLPFFVLGIVANGFICGWRATLFFGSAVMMTIWALWLVSGMYTYTPVFDVERFADRNFQRAVQASLATFMITLVAGFFSKSMHDAFGDLEAGIREARASDDAKTAFLATMSHELCTPMNGIIAMSDMLAETPLTEEQAELTEIIARSGADLQTIIGNVLLFSQLDAERVTLDDSPFDLTQAIETATRAYAPAAAAKGLGLTTAIRAPLPAQVIGDTTRVTQILGALIDNAVKFTQAGGIRLDVFATAPSSSRVAVIVSVTDTGPGVAPENRARIFERFTQGDGSITRHHGGTGLGLTVALGLIRLMGGDITLSEDTGEAGTGATFNARFVFSVAETDAQPDADLAIAA